MQVCKLGFGNLLRWEKEIRQLTYSAAECTKIARFSAVAAAIFTAPPQNRAIFKAQDAQFPL